MCYSNVIYTLQSENKLPIDWVTMMSFASTIYVQHCRGHVVGIIVQCKRDKNNYFCHACLLLHLELQN